ncbi:Aste57867_5779 [Aphanomyces stellatus]|uniref:Aste57867_5779 protein n=1 Tax=Aphanomyces stellatus TaxID=120398 RepID=A0A485KDC5_9STRA|nr:hypothetical protein As57867_005765 [Aphanomyces stellatus]VFT82803.1 Aste57867_5779 [Aphanomyces stellatus]
MDDTLGEPNLLALPSEERVVDSLLDFCDTGDVKARVDRFIATHAQTFSDFDVHDEWSHETYRLFQEYEALFADAVAAFLDRQEMSPASFDAVMVAVQQAKESNSHANLSLLLSAFDLETFGRRMQDEAIAQQKAAKEADDMGLG